MWKVITESKIYDHFDEQKLKYAAEECQFRPFKKGEVVFKKNEEYTKGIFVLLNTDVKGQTVTYKANSVIEANQLLDKKGFKVKEDLLAVDNGSLCKLNYEFDLGPTPISIQFRNKQESTKSEDKSALEKKMQVSDFIVVRRLR